MTNHKEPELKECPFCGAEAILETKIAWPDVYVICKECFNCTNHYDHWGKAYKAWNTRSPQKKEEPTKKSLDKQIAWCECGDGLIQQEDGDYYCIGCDDTYKLVKVKKEEPAMELNEVGMTQTEMEEIDYALMCYLDKKSRLIVLEKLDKLGYSKVKLQGKGLVKLDRLKVGAFLESFATRACQVPADNWVNFIADTNDEFCSIFGVTQPGISREEIENIIHSSELCQEATLGKSWSLRRKLKNDLAKAILNHLESRRR